MSITDLSDYPQCHFVALVGKPGNVIKIAVYIRDPGFAETQDSIITVSCR